VVCLLAGAAWGVFSTAFSVVRVAVGIVAARIITGVVVVVVGGLLL